MRPRGPRRPLRPRSPRARRRRGALRVGRAERARGRQQGRAGGGGRRRRVRHGRAPRARPRRARGRGERRRALHARGPRRRGRARDGRGLPRLRGVGARPRGARAPPLRRRAVTPRRPLPAALAAAALVAALLFALPLAGLVARAPWPRLGAELARAEVRDALLLSLRCSLGAALLSLVLGLPLALWLAEGTSRLRALVRVLVTLPMVLPPVVGGVALLLAFGRQGLVGAPLAHAFGGALPFTTAGVVVAEAYVAMPFFVLTLEAGLRALDPRYAQAAASLGARPWRVLRTVTLPLVAPSLVAGLVAAWARALGEFGATITFAGSLRGETRTLPLAVYAALETSPDAAIALSLVLVAVAALVLFLLRRQWFPGGAR
ncbi:MAG: molybdate ABC transporter permease subunit [Planctomycetes bacterium]|nr:molybdate ABC transporter permease subunit [Planctomycetota bacterium]